MKRKTTEDFIIQSRIIHKDLYDYSLVEYVNNYTDVKIICKKHGVIKQKPHNHLNGSGCKYCTWDNKKSNSEDFIEKSKKIHKNKYDYSHVTYMDNHTHVDIICPKHGIFKQTPMSHLIGNNCNKCSLEDLSLKNSMGLENFIIKATKIHNGKYDYSNVKYINSKNQINIICQKHGEYTQKPSEHLKGKGCRYCALGNISKPEIEVQEFVKSLKFQIETNSKKIIKPYELDIYIPELNKAIEFNGTYWHYDRSNPKCKPKGYHGMKSKLCRDKNIKLLHIREDLWYRNSEKMKKIILKFLK